MKFSIIIPNYNKKDFLKQCLESIEQHLSEYPDFEVIIVDNGSTDGSKLYLRKINTKINGQVIYNDINKGYAIPNNQGAKIAKGEYLIFLNNDTIVTSNWLENIEKAFSWKDKIGAVGVKLIHPGKGTIQHAGVIEHDKGQLEHIYFGEPENYILANVIKEYFAVTGACLAIPRSLFNELGGLDEKYWCGWEDMDLCQKIHQKGYRIVYTPYAKVYHYESRTEGRYIAEGLNFDRYMKTWVLNKKVV